MNFKIRQDAATDHGWVSEAGVKGSAMDSAKKMPE